jgi:hypothetical protein
MSKIILGAGAALSVMVVSTAAMAQSNSLATWLDTVNKQIEQSIVSPRNGDAGIATVTFQRGADGRPIVITTRGPGTELSRAARLTAMRLRLPPLPAGLGADQRVTMKIMFGGYDGEQVYGKRHAQMLADAANTNQRIAARISPVEVANRETHP